VDERRVSEAAVAGASRSTGWRGEGLTKKTEVKRRAAERMTAKR